MVKPQPSKLMMRVRFSLGAPTQCITMIYTHLKIIEKEVNQALRMIDASKTGTAPMLARLMSIEREIYFIKYLLNKEEEN